MSGTPAMVTELAPVTISGSDVTTAIITSPTQLPDSPVLLEITSA
jgi:hypothetical protein